MLTDGVFSCQFEVYGRVQGVYFRHHAMMKAKTLGLRGWCMNTAKGTVRGYIEGRRHEIDVMKEWLKTTGSPGSNVERVKFSRKREKEGYGFPNFQVRCEGYEKPPIQMKNPISNSGISR
ncbi:acylphosphatase-1 [Drosophila subobscura]|uniref:acylphosphatase-1 n=1 Tax=Drosophila subobscura TaxID=7241 RepID=UPI00155AB84C|nr:acylphosphatase-1 [Drosophila subobscura]